MLAVIVYLFACWFGRPKKVGHQLKDIEKLAVTLRLVIGRIRAGAVDWRLGVVNSDLPASIGEVIEAAWLEGKPVKDSLSSLEHQLRLGARLAGEQFDLRRLYWTRSGLVGLVALGVEVLNPQDLEVVANIREQLMSGVLAASVYFAGCFLIRSATPLPWVALTEAHNEKLSSWLATHINGESFPPSEWACSMDELKDREFSQGVSLLAEKRRLLEDWSEDQLRAARQRLTLVADLMPIGEIVGLGVPLIILLFHNLSQFSWAV